MTTAVFRQLGLACTLALTAFSAGAGDLSGPVLDDGVAIRLTDVVQLPATSAVPPLARINFLRQAPDGLDRLFVNDLRGPLYIIDGPALHTYLDLRTEFPDLRNTPGLASGFVSFEFHPEFAGNGIFYTVHTEYVGDTPPNLGPALPTTIDQHAILTEWTAADPLSNIFQGTRRELMRIAAPTRAHNIGEIAFNPGAQSGDEDYGLLYVVAGDFGSVVSQQSEQLDALDTPFGSILRIDPLGGPFQRDGIVFPYGIPPSNPYAGDGDPETLGEIYASGFRNPHRIAWDTGGAGTLFVTDIGENNLEEINVVVPGADYGWPQREGTYALDVIVSRHVVFPLPPDDATFGFTYPAAQYDHMEGFAIASGFPYRQPDTSLSGKFVLGDIVTGRLLYADVDALLAADDGDPATTADLFELWVVHDGVVTTILDLIRAALGDPDISRTDLRLAMDRSGDLYLMTKQDGFIRKVEGVEVLPPALVMLHGTVTRAGTGLAGVTIAATNGASCTQSGPSGDYACTVPSGWSGTATPALAGHVFTPASRSYVGVDADRTAQDYLAAGPLDPVAHWRLDEASGTTASDGSGRGNDGVLLGPASWTAGHLGGALSFDGTTQEVRVADSPSLSIEGGGVTLAGWMFPTQAQSGVMVHKDYHFSLIRRADGALSYADSRTWSYAAIGDHGDTPLDAWSHVAVTFDGASIRFYVDGALVSTVVRAGSLSDTASALYLGSYDGTGNRFAGLLDDIRIYDRALSAPEVAALHGAGVVDTAAPALASVTATAEGTVEVRYDEVVDAATAGAPGNYTIDGGVAVSQAVLGADGRTVTLATTPLTAAVTYTLSVAGVEDVAGNPVAPGTQATFEYLAAGPLDPVAHWRLDEASGTTASDGSGRGNDGVLLGPASWTAGHLGGALSFDGTTQEVRVADSPSLSIEGGGVTLAGWMFPTQAQSGVMVHKDYHFSLIRRADGALSYADSRTWSYAAIGGHGDTPLDAWSHVAVTFDGASIRFYVDGALVSTVVRAGSLSDTASALYLGSYDGTGNRFAGLLDDVRIYDRALSAPEVAALHGAGVVDTAAPALASVTATAEDTVEVRYDEVVDAATAGAPGNYTIDGGVAVSQAVLGADGRTVTLATTPLTAAVTYTLSVAGVEDVAGNPVAPGTQATFEYLAAGPLDPVAHWRLDEASGTTASDGSGRGNDGVLLGPASWTAGHLGGALSFDGTTQEVRVADSPSLSIEGGGVTLAGWMFPTQAQSGVMVHKDYHFSLIRRADGALSYADSRTWSYAAIGGHGDTPLDAWSHVAVTFDGASIRFYVDGALVSTVVRAGSLSDTASALYLGSYDGTGNRFAGLLDDIRIYDRALSAPGVAALFAGE